MYKQEHSARSPVQTCPLPPHPQSHSCVHSILPPPIATAHTHTIAPARPPAVWRPLPLRRQNLGRHAGAGVTGNRDPVTDPITAVILSQIAAPPQRQNLGRRNGGGGGPCSYRPPPRPGPCPHSGTRDVAGARLPPRLLTHSSCPSVWLDLPTSREPDSRRDRPTMKHIVVALPRHCRVASRAQSTVPMEATRPAPRGCRPRRARPRAGPGRKARDPDTPAEGRDGISSRACTSSISAGRGQSWVRGGRGAGVGRGGGSNGNGPGVGVIDCNGPGRAEGG